MTVFRQLKERMIQDIENMPPHTRLPPRLVLSEQYFVCRQTIDRVVSQLCTEGYLYAVRGAGTYVSDPALDISQQGKLPMRTIGVILPTHGINSSTLVQNGVTACAQANHIHVIFCTSDHSPGKQFSYLRRLCNAGVSGFLIQPPGIDEPYHDVSAFLQAHRVPVVFMFDRFPGMGSLPLVRCNRVSGTLIAMQHLLKRGYRRIGYVCNHLSSLYSDQGASFYAAQRLFDLPCVSEHVIITSDTQGVFVEKVCHLLQTENPPDAFICFNDTVAKGVYEAARLAGLTIPGQLGVIGADNSLVCDTLIPRLTSVDIRAAEMGHAAMSLMLDFWDVDHPPRLHTMLEPELFLRESCLGPG